MIPKCTIPTDAHWSVKHMPITESITRLISRYYKSQENWYNAPAWEQRAFWHYAQLIAKRWRRLADCHCQYLNEL